jgi:hypothetical protein
VTRIVFIQVASKEASWVSHRFWTRFVEPFVSVTTAYAPNSLLHWIKRFILFHDKQHPSTLGEAEVAQFLSFLTNEGQVAAATQNLALNALVFLYKVVLEHGAQPLDGLVLTPVWIS